MQNSQGRYGNVLMTRTAPLEIQKIDLSHDSVEPRGAIRARLDVSGRSVEVLTTHLGLLGLERRQQLDTLEASWTTCDDPEAVRILIGDLNEWNPWTRQSRRLVESFGSIPHPRTFPAKWPLFRLDRVCIRPARVEYHVEAIRTPLTRVASDHLPLVAEIVKW
jgi:endonuclease/exonuclease/phosphatase family metal-dependent hydrolase